MEKLKYLIMFWIVAEILSITPLYGEVERKYLKKITRIISSMSYPVVEEKWVPTPTDDGKIEMLRQQRSEEFQDRVEYIEETGDYLYICKDDQGKVLKILFEPYNKIDVIIECQVNKDSEGNYLYKYIVTNALTSKQDLGNFGIDIRSDRIVEEGHPSGWHYFSGSRWRQEIFWGKIGREDMISPGNKTIFEISSKSPPVIVKCYAQGHPKEAPYIVSVNGEKLTKEEYYKRYPYGYEKDAIALKLEDNCVTGYTLGPGQIGTNKEIATLLEENTELAYEMGWLGDNEYKKLSEIIKKNNKGKLDFYKIFKSKVKKVKDRVAPEYIQIVNTIFGE